GTGVIREPRRRRRCRGFVRSFHRSKTTVEGEPDMKTGKMAFAVIGIVLAGVLAASAVQIPAAQPAGRPYIPLISKGFQHQFWQAVKQGALQAAKDYNVSVTFEEI